MEFLDQLVIPQKAPNLELLNFLLILAKIIFIVYSGVLLSSFVFSVYYNYAWKKSKNPHHHRISRDFIDLITFNKIIAFGMGLVPFLSIIIIYIQLLHKTAAPVVDYLVISFVFYLIAIVLAYTYKHSLHLSDIISGVSQKDEIEEGDVYHYSPGMSRLAWLSGIFGVLILAGSLRLFVAASAVAVDNTSWKNINSLFDVMISWPSIITYVHFITGSLAVMGLAFIVKIFFWDKFTNPSTDAYKSYAGKLNASVSMIFILFQPALLVLNIMITPATALSNFMFLMAFFAFALSLILAHLVYNMLKEGSFRFVQVSFYIVLFLLSFIIVKEQYAFTVTNRLHVESLAADYAVIEQKEREAAGIGVVKVNGEEIYKAKCTACHKYEEKLVGPPHKLVLQKYTNNRQGMVKFILNPVKVDPAYPPMPAQGLKPNEAEAVVDYMFKHYGSQVK